MSQQTSPVSTSEKHVYLIDASGFIFRAYHALPPLNRADGTPVGAVMGYTNILLKLLTEHKPSHMAVVFDSARLTFRNDLYAAYKANRTDPPEDLIPQFPLVREATDAFGLPRIEMSGFEADDIIATLATQARDQGIKVTIVSSDKDLMQLIEDGIRMWDPIKNIPIETPQVIEKFGVTPDKVIDVQALCGDSVDNVPGVPGIGVKTAAELINIYGDLETLLARAEEIKQPKRRETLITNRDAAEISKVLVTLRRDVPIEETLDACCMPDFDPQNLLPFLQSMGLTSILNRLQKQAGGALQVPEAPKPVSAPRPTAETAADEPAFEAVSYSFPHDKYRTILKANELEEWLSKLGPTDILAVDTETTGLTPAAADLVGISLGRGNNEAIYIPLSHRSANPLMEPDPDQMPLAEAVALLKPILEDPSRIKTGHNLKFDWQMLKKAGIDMSPMDDTLLMSYLIDGSAHGHGMDELARLHYGHETISYDALTGKGASRISFADVGLDLAGPYAAEDADVSHAFYETLKPRLPQAKVTGIYEDIERPLIKVIAEMELQGIKVDPSILQNLSAKFGTKLAELECEIFALSGHSFNIASPKQLGVILFSEMGLPGGKKTKTGEWSTSAEVLEDLADQGHDFAYKILEWRQLAKLISTYTDALPKSINPKTGRVHTSFAMALTNTGRLSSSDPNLQNIPIRTEEGRSIRSAFVTDAGWTLISADYSQIELRLAAEMAGIPRMLDAFRHDLDIHAITAAEMFGLKVEDVSSELRRQAKAINFGIIYGISSYGLARQVGRPQGEAAAFIRQYFDRFPELKAFMERSKEEARQHGYVRTFLGRKCIIAGINDKNHARRSGAERQAINAPLQGAAADIIKLAMVALPDALKQAGLKARMLLQVHDELVFEAPDDEVEATKALLKQVMENVVSFSVPLKVEVGSAANWADAH